MRICLKSSHRDKNNQFLKMKAKRILNKTKNERLEVRISYEDKNKIAQLARQVNMSMSEFLISSALRRKLSPAKLDVDTYATLAQMLWEINKIGHNFNQLVKTCHVSQQKGEPIVVDTNALLNVNYRLAQTIKVVKIVLKKMK
jgi:hypothetical protein